MTVLLFSLRGVPDDEADEVRALLAEEGIDFYETPAGNWGVSMPALWLRNKEDVDKARQLLAAYQEQRFHAARAAYLQSKQSGTHKTLFQAFTEQPLLHGCYWLSSALVLYVSIKWLMELGVDN